MGLVIIPGAALSRRELYVAFNVAAAGFDHGKLIRGTCRRGNWKWGSSSYWGMYFNITSLAGGRVVGNYTLKVPGFKIGGVAPGPCRLRVDGIDAATFGAKHFPRALADGIGRKVLGDGLFRSAEWTVNVPVSGILSMDESSMSGLRLPVYPLAVESRGWWILVFDVYRWA
jgi:hypothetical protein